MFERIFAPGIRFSKATIRFDWPRVRCRSNAFDMMLVAPLVLIATGMMGCANQKLADDQPAVTLENAKRPHPRVTRAMATRQSAPTAQQRDASPAAPEQANNPAADAAPEQDDTTGSIIRPAPIVREMAAAEPRTVRAMNCRDQMLKEHPPVRFGANGNATAQRDFFDGCMRREGNGP